MTALCFSPFCALFFHHFGYGRIASKCICRQALGFHTHTQTHTCAQLMHSNAIKGITSFTASSEVKRVCRTFWGRASLLDVLAAGPACATVFFWRSRRSYLIKTWVDKLSSEAGVECRGRQSKMAAAAAAVGS